MNVPSLSPPVSSAVRLTYPILTEDSTIEEIRIRLMWREEMSFDADADLAAFENMATATGLPADVILELDRIDWNTLCAAYRLLFARQPEHLKPTFGEIADAH